MRARGEPLTSSQQNGELRVSVRSMRCCAWLSALRERRPAPRSLHISMSHMLLLVVPVTGHMSAYAGDRDGHEICCNVNGALRCLPKHVSPPSQTTECPHAGVLAAIHGHITRLFQTGLVARSRLRPQGSASTSPCTLLPPAPIPVSCALDALSSLQGGLNQVRRPLRKHDGRGVGIAAWNRWKCTRVHLHRESSPWTRSKAGPRLVETS